MKGGVYRMLTKTQYGSDNGQCYQKAGYRVEEPEESPAKDDGDSRPHGRYSPRVEIAESKCREQYEDNSPYPFLPF